jgi:hypothetical protein
VDFGKKRMPVASMLLLRTNEKCSGEEKSVWVFALLQLNAACDEPRAPRVPILGNSNKGTVGYYDILRAAKKNCDCRWSRQVIIVSQLAHCLSKEESHEVISQFVLSVKHRQQKNQPLPFYFIPFIYHHDLPTEFPSNSSIALASNVVVSPNERLHFSQRPSTDRL